MTKEKAIAEYIKAGGSFDQDKVVAKMLERLPVRRKRGRKGKGRSNFYSIVIGRLKSKDIELGEFTIEVDYATLNRYTNKWIKDEIIGKTVTVSGVSGQFRDNLLLIKKGQTLKVRTSGYNAEDKPFSSHTSSMYWSAPFRLILRLTEFRLRISGDLKECFRVKLLKQVATRCL